MARCGNTGLRNELPSNSTKGYLPVHDSNLETRSRPSVSDGCQAQPGILAHERFGRHSRVRTPRARIAGLLGVAHGKAPSSMFGAWVGSSGWSDGQAPRHLEVGSPGSASPRLARARQPSTITAWLATRGLVLSLRDSLRDRRWAVPKREQLRVHRGWPRGPCVDRIGAAALPPCRPVGVPIRPN